MKKIYLASSNTASGLIKWLAAGRNGRRDEVSSMLIGMDQPIPPMFREGGTLQPSLGEADKGFGQYILQNTLPKGLA